MACHLFNTKPLSEANVDWAPFFRDFFSQNSNIFIEENEYEDVTYKVVIASMCYSKMCAEEKLPFFVWVAIAWDPDYFIDFIPGFIS